MLVDRPRKFQLTGVGQGVGENADHVAGASRVDWGIDLSVIYRF